MSGHVSQPVCHSLNVGVRFMALAETNELKPWAALPVKSAAATGHSC